MASCMRQAEHKIQLRPNGQYNYRLKKMVLGDFILLRDWDQYPNLARAARDFAKRNPGWDFHMGRDDQGRPVMWRIA